MLLSFVKLSKRVTEIPHIAFTPRRNVEVPIHLHAFSKPTRMQEKQAKLHTDKYMSSVLNFRS